MVELDRFSRRIEPDIPAGLQPATLKPGRTPQKGSPGRREREPEQRLGVVELRIGDRPAELGFFTDRADDVRIELADVGGVKEPRISRRTHLIVIFAAHDVADTVGRDKLLAHGIRRALAVSERNQPWPLDRRRPRSPVRVRHQIEFGLAGRHPQTDGVRRGRIVRHGRDHRSSG
jgi:hypothetical protein